jgi:hypothetical protein
MLHLTKIIIPCALLITVLAACGGGGGAPDTTAPTVDLGPQVDAARHRVTAVFSESMDAATINSSTFTLEDNTGTAVTGTVSYQGVAANFTPNVQLASSATYTATITTDALDVAGNRIANEVRWPFTTASGKIAISWDRNLETAVNRSGGGYKLYYSSISGFDSGDPGVTKINIAYKSGVAAPTSVLIPLDPGTYYIRIAAYSDLNPPGSSSGSVSTLSPQITLNAP